MSIRWNTLTACTTMKAILGWHVQRGDVTEAAPVAQILTHIGESPRPPLISPARGPPAWDEAPEPMPDWDLLGQPEPDFAFDQRVSW